MVRLKAGIRPSPLAFKQAEEIRRLLPSLDFEAIAIETAGDKDKTTPLSEVEGTDFFTKEVEDALLDGRIDFAIHSAKDMPENLRPGLIVAAVTKPIDGSDALVSKDNLKLDELKYGARIGASSQRRKEQLKRYRQDLEIIDIRGNIGERLNLLDEKHLDAVIVASAALIRLGLEDKIAQRIPAGILKPHPFQGALAIQTAENRKDVMGIFKKIDGK